MPAGPSRIRGPEAGPAPAAPLDAAALRRRFDAVAPFTVGVEEEALLVDRETLDLAPVAADVLGALAGDPRFKPELPAAQLEIVTAPAVSAAEAIAELAGGRRALCAAAEGIALPIAAGVHPFAAAGPLSRGPRYEEIRRDYRGVAHRQLVASLQVHVAVGGADRTLAVYNALRCHLPELAALAANAPLYEGADTGLASVRPLICVLLPRQGVPPPLQSWEHFAGELAWLAGSGSIRAPSEWWWELRPHAVHGTLELRVLDAQTTLTEAAGLIGLVHALVVSLAERHDAGEALPAAPTWRIQENRWSALRDGLDGSLADLDSGRRVPTRERLAALIDEVEPVARRLGGGRLLDHARASVRENGAIRQRRVLAARGMGGLVAWLAERFRHPCGEG